jgi:hypothetical protein
MSARHSRVGVQSCQQVECCLDTSAQTLARADACFCLRTLRHFETDWQIGRECGEDVEQGKLAGSRRQALEFRLFRVLGEPGHQRRITELDVADGIAIQRDNVGCTRTGTNQVHRVDEQPAIRLLYVANGGERGGEVGDRQPGTKLHHRLHTE